MKKALLVAILICAFVLGHGALRSAAQGETASVVVSPETGAVLTSPDGLVTITFPAGMFAEPTTVTYTDTPLEALPEALMRIGPSFTLEAARAKSSPCYWPFVN